jgi:hypothetical protein
MSSSSNAVQRSSAAPQSSVSCPAPKPDHLWCFNLSDVPVIGIHAPMLPIWTQFRLSLEAESQPREVFLLRWCRAEGVHAAYAFEAEYNGVIIGVPVFSKDEVVSHLLLLSCAIVRCCEPFFILQVSMLRNRSRPVSKIPVVLDGPCRAMYEEQVRSEATTIWRWI